MNQEITPIDKLQKQWNNFMPKNNGMVTVERKYGTKTRMFFMTESEAKLEGFLSGDQRSALKEIYIAYEIKTAPVAIRTMGLGEVRSTPKPDYDEYTKRLLDRYNMWSDFCVLQGKSPYGHAVIMDSKDMSLNEVGMKYLVTVPTFQALYGGALDIYLDVKEAQHKEKPLRLSLTDRMQECKEYIEQHTIVYGSSPTISEISNGIKTSPSNAHRIVSTLVERGHLYKISGKARCLVTI